NAATDIANHYQLSDQDYFTVLGAAWFHDIGYFIDPAHHEEKGAQEAILFLKRKGVEEQVILAVTACIYATPLPQKPRTLLEQIVAGAELFHFGTPKFSDYNKAMRREYMALHHVSISKDEWRHRTIELLQSHQYHTDYCRVLLNDIKTKNL